MNYKVKSPYTTLKNAHTIIKNKAKKLPKLSPRRPSKGKHKVFVPVEDTMGFAPTFLNTLKEKMNVFYAKIKGWYEPTHK